MLFLPEQICNTHSVRHPVGGDIMNTQRWILCPICGNKTRVRVRQDTELKNFPLFCPKCKKESLISFRNDKMYTVIEPDAKSQSH